MADPRYATKTLSQGLRSIGDASRKFRLDCDQYSAFLKWREMLTPENKELVFDPENGLLPKFGEYIGLDSKAQTIFDVNLEKTRTLPSKIPERLKELPELVKKEGGEYKLSFDLDRQGITQGNVVCTYLKSGEY